MRRLVRVSLASDYLILFLLAVIRESPGMLISDCHAHVTSRDEKRYPLKAAPLQIPDDKGYPRRSVGSFRGKRCVGNACHSHYFIL